MTSVCIIGAGPAGLAAARNLQQRGIAYDHLEGHSGVGGIWDITNPGTPMYESAHFISSRTLSGYYGFPMPEHFADYPGRRQVLAYTQAFAKAYGLLERVRFNTRVRACELRDDGRWQVQGEDGFSRDYSHVVCATGHTWVPNWPTYQGQFSGERMHSVEYKTPERFRGKRVLIVGAGNSACDIACEAARHADVAIISMRRGYHFIPKHVFGVPADVFAQQSDWLPGPLKRWAFERLLRLINGDLTSYGLPAPDHRVLESHPIINSQLIHYLQHGDLRVRPDIERLQGEEVVFTNGVREQVDLVLYATGYRCDIPYVEHEHFVWEAGKPKLAYTVFNPKHDTLFAAGFTEMNAGGYYIFDEMTSLIADAIALQGRDPERWREARRQLLAPLDLSGGLRLVDSPRHAGYLDMATYLAACRRLSRRLGWIPARERLQAVPPAISTELWPDAACAGT